MRLEARKAAQVSEFLTGLLTSADPFEGAHQGEPTVRSLLDAGVALGRGRTSPRSPNCGARCSLSWAGYYQRRGAYEQALPLLQEAVALGRPLGPGRELAQSLNDLGVALGKRAKLDAAGATLEEALAMRRKVLGEGHQDAAVTSSELGRVLLDQGRLG